MRGEQFDGQMRFYTDRLRAASQARLARQVKRYGAAVSALQERNADKRSAIEQATCSLPLVRQTTFCRDAI